MIHPLELLEPEDFVGNLWHDWASRLAAPDRGAASAAVTLEEMHPSVALLFRALGGPAGAEIAASASTAADRRLSMGERLAGARPQEHRALFAGERLRLPRRSGPFPAGH